MAFLSEQHPRFTVHEYSEDYYRERDHQRVGNELLPPSARPAKTVAELSCRKRLGGLLKYYYREAA